MGRLSAGGCGRVDTHSSHLVTDTAHFLDSLVGMGREVGSLVPGVYMRRARRDAEARPHRLREHGAGLLPARRRGRGGRRRADRAQPAAASPARSTSRRSRRSSTRATPTRCGCCRASASPRRARSTRSSSSRGRRSSAIRTVAVTPERATSVVLTKVLLPDAEHVPLGEDAEAKLLIGDAALQSRVRGSDAAPRPRPPVARAHRPADGVRRLGVRRSRRTPGLPSSRTRSSRPSAPRARSPSCSRYEAARALRLPGRLPRPLLREAPLPLRAARARRPATRSSSSRATSASSTRCPELRFVTRGGDRLTATATRRRHRRDPRPRARRRADHRRDALALLESRDLVAVGRVANELRARRTDPDRDHLHRRPQPQLHERLRHRLRLLRLLPPPGRPPRGVPAAEAGDLQEDRGDARARRHRRADAGRPPPRPRRRLLRGPLQLDQGALPDPPARALAARGRSTSRAARSSPSPRRSRACATPASTRSPAAAARSSSTASARSSRRRRRRRPSG